MEDLNAMGIKVWRGILQNKLKWRGIVVTAKTLRE